MAGKRGSGFDRFFDEQMKDPAFASAYKEARTEIDSTDNLIRALDEARALRDLTKAELARRMQAKPEILRRLFTTKTSNPTLTTVLTLVSALGYHLELVPNGPRSKSRNSRS